MSLETTVGIAVALFTFLSPKAALAMCLLALALLCVYALASYLYHIDRRLDLVEENLGMSKEAY